MNIIDEFDMTNRTQENISYQRWENLKLNSVTPFLKVLGCGIVKGALIIYQSKLASATLFQGDFTCQHFSSFNETLTTFTAP